MPNAKVIKMNNTDYLYSVRSALILALMDLPTVFDATIVGYMLAPIIAFLAAVVIVIFELASGNTHKGAAVLGFITFGAILVPLPVTGPIIAIAVIAYRMFTHRMRV